MNSETFTFDKVTRSRTVVGKCPVCGKRSLRRRTFEQTVNPWNRRDDGTPKSPAEVGAAVEAEAAAWIPDFTHDGCETS